MNYYSEQTLIGQVTITEERGFITSLNFGEYKISGKFSYIKNYRSDILKQAFNQLEEYLLGKRKVFDLPLNPKGTPFQQKVWSALLKIPYGETRSYKDIAEMIGKEKSFRAVGTANHENKIPVFIPCHRVITSEGSIGGYAGGVDLKQKLLKIEQNAIEKVYL